MLLAVQADGSSVETVEGLSDGDELAVLQQAFHEHHALQCGYCTPGMLMSATALLRQNPHPSEDEIKKGLRTATSSPCSSRRSATITRSSAATARPAC